MFGQGLVCLWGCYNTITKGFSAVFSVLQPILVKDKNYVLHIRYKNSVRAVALGYYGVEHLSAYLSSLGPLCAPNFPLRWLDP